MPRRTHSETVESLVNLAMQAARFRTCEGDAHQSVPSTTKSAAPGSPRSHIIWKTPIGLATGSRIPDHHLLRLGTFSSILRAVAQHKGVQRGAMVAHL